MASNADFYDDVRDSIEDESTIEDTVSTGQEIILSYINLAILSRLDLKDSDDKIDVPVDNVLYDYLTELKRAAIKVELDDGEYNKYKYRPDLLSYDLYGTTTYEFVILALNDIISPKYFTKKTLYIISSDYIEELVTDIYNAEQTYVTFNRSEYDTVDEIAEILDDDE